ncbi:hypothetical protein EVAR_48824_1 [Eumeta japonica]|uniref:Uncharacterized protein n=1 Tax=Eumeta variegata TaxID=151549 RepID=A0A4C1Y0P0_EUMVA|nr:hypothetical protein EVAR_48824_1 [Eumeta japonica]
MDTHNPKGIAITLPTSSEEIEQLIEEDRFCGRGRVGIGHRIRIHRMKRNSRSCYFTSVFCESVIFHSCLNNSTVRVKQWRNYRAAGLAKCHGPPTQEGPSPRCFKSEDLDLTKSIPELSDAAPGTSVHPDPEQPQQGTSKNQSEPYFSVNNIESSPYVTDKGFRGHREKADSNDLSSRKLLSIVELLGKAKKFAMGPRWYSYATGVKHFPVKKMEEPKRAAAKLDKLQTQI